MLSAAALAQQNVPAPSQVLPPVITPPQGGGRIALPQVPAGAIIPEQAKKLSFKLLGFSIQGEFDELKAARVEIEKPLLGRRVTVADVFEFANQLQQIYVRAGYPLARVVILPQEFEKSARIKLRVIDGFVERMELESISSTVRGRVAAVLAPLLRKTHLKQTELERRLLIAGEAPGLILNAVFASGKEVGGSVLVLAGRYRPVSVSVYTDNAMPTSLGTGQVVTSASLNGLLGAGEQLTVSAAGLPDRDFNTRYPTRRYLSATALIPLGIDGWKLEIGGTDGKTTPRVNLDARSQGLLSQGRAKLSYDVIKLRDLELTFNGRFDATDEQVDTLLFTPQVPLHVDRLRVLRGGFDGVWRLRQTGTTFIFGSNFSRGLKAFGARTAADAAASDTPLSRADADAVFNKWDGRFEVNQSLPYDFITSVAASGQTSFNHALLTSEQFSIDGAKMLSGFTSGALPGDTSWVVRGEVGRPFALPIGTGGVTLTPYIFAATGERIAESPSALEVKSIHATNMGTGLRFNLAPWAEFMPDGYGFIEWSRRRTTDSDPLGHNLNGDRIFTGMLLRY
ncbi:MAG: beta-barrel domain secretion protein [Bradyrhizobium sp.]|nr:beta-barrel domain secretion protein [Bradyrhizobium sp.]